MIPRWIAPVLVFFLLAALLVTSQVYWFRWGRQLVGARRKPWQRWLLAVPIYGWFFGMVALVLLVPVTLLVLAILGNSPVLHWLLVQLRRPMLAVPVGLWIAGSMFSFLFIVLVRGTDRLIARLRQRASDAPDPVAPGRRYFLETATYAAGALPFVMAGYGFLVGRQDYRVEEVNVPVTNLPEGLEGLRLLQLTDVHSSAYMPVSEVRRVVGLARELGADIVFHTGDFITSRGDPLAEAIQELARVQGHYGSFGCLGNHEDYADATDLSTELFARQGVRILRQQNAELEIRGARLNLIGVDYQRHTRGPGPELSKRDWLHGVQRLVRSDALNILLCHNPNPFLRAAELGIELTLAGHTHGGQVQVEILDSRWSPARFITPFVSGLYEHGGKRLYVSRGIGTIGAPVRLSAPPEITLLRLRRA